MSHRFILYSKKDQEVFALSDVKEKLAVNQQVKDMSQFD
jgi:hypothetical protein